MCLFVWTSGQMASFPSVLTERTFIIGSLRFGTVSKASSFLQLLTFDATLRFSIDEQIMHLLLEKWLYSLGLGYMQTKTGDQHIWNGLRTQIWFQSPSKGLDGYLNLTHLISIRTIELATQNSKPQEGRLLTFLIMPASHQSSHISMKCPQAFWHVVVFPVQAVVSLKEVGVGDRNVETGHRVWQSSCQGWEERVEEFAFTLPSALSSWRRKNFGRNKWILQVNFTKIDLTSS